MDLKEYLVPINRTMITGTDAYLMSWLYQQFEKQNLNNYFMKNYEFILESIQTTSMNDVNYHFGDLLSGIGYKTQADNIVEFILEHIGIESKTHVMQFGGIEEPWELDDEAEEELIKWADYCEAEGYLTYHDCNNTEIAECAFGYKDKAEWVGASKEVFITDEHIRGTIYWIEVRGLTDKVRRIWEELNSGNEIIEHKGKIYILFQELEEEWDPFYSSKFFNKLIEEDLICHSIRSTLPAFEGWRDRSLIKFFNELQRAETSEVIF